MKCPVSSGEKWRTQRTKRSSVGTGVSGPPKKINLTRGKTAEQNLLWQHILSIRQGKKENILIMEIMNETLYYLIIIHLTLLRHMILLYSSSDTSFRLSTLETKRIQYKYDSTGHLAATQFWIGCMYNKHISGLWLVRSVLKPFRHWLPSWLSETTLQRQKRWCVLVHIQR